MTNSECYRILELPVGASDALIKKQFKKLKELDDFPTKVITKKNFNVSEFKSIYRKEEIGRYNIVLAFNKNHTRFYYKALYY